MIGSLSTLESSFGFLWGSEIEDGDKTPEQKRLYEIYEEARAQILDRGNTQIRNLESEFRVRVGYLSLTLTLNSDSNFSIIN